eukprot:COSAG01_NODE_2017_length_8638_cov_15.453917_3_plen_149_part_00
MSQHGELLSRRGRSLRANASGLDTHRDSITSRCDCSSAQLQEWERQQVGDLGSPHTDATVWVELVGTGPDGRDVSSGRRVLAQSLEGGGHVVFGHHGKVGCTEPGQLFRGGGRDEFTLACADLHAIHTCVVRPSNDGVSMHAMAVPVD